MGLALYIVTVVGCGYLAYLTYTSHQRRSYDRMAKAALGLVAWIAIYLLALTVVSLASRDRIVGPGEEVVLCGIDPSCSLSASVIGLRRTKTVGNPPRELIAAGVFYVVTLRVTSTAANPAFKPGDLSGYVVDENGREFSMVPQAERELLSEMTSSGAASTSAAEPARNAYKKLLVLDVAPDVREPTLVITEGSALERLVEWFIMGDEASLLHGKPRIPLRIRTE